MGSKVKYYLDEHVNPAVAEGLRRRGIDVITTAEAGMLGVSDIEHLLLAKRMQRSIFSQDKDFLRLHAQGIEHAGIIYFPKQTDIGRIVTGLHWIYETLTAEEMVNRLEYI